MAKKREYRSKMAPVLWATALLYTPLAQALGLGALTVDSNLGQRLHAEIPLFAVHAADRHHIHVRIASEADFAAAGLRKSRALRAIDCAVRRTPSGGYDVILRSRQPVDVPFLHFLLKVRWPGGSLLHAYTAFLNPASGVTLLRAGAPRIQAVGMPSIHHPHASAMPAPPAAPATADTRTTVRRGETLWAVAMRTTAGRGTMPQTLEAFLRTNPQAFFHKNVNDLRAGAILTIPSRRTIRAISPQGATQWLAAQDAAWSHYKTVLAENPTRVPGTRAGITGRIASLHVLPPHREALKIEAAPLRDAGATATGTRQGGTGAAAAQIARLKRELAKTKRLMTLENSELAMLQDQAGQAHKVATAHAAVVGALGQAPHPVVARGVGKTVAKRPMQAARLAPVRHVMSPVRPLPPVAPPPSFLASLLTSERTPILGGLLVIVLAGGLLVIRRRRQTMAEFEESILSGGGLNSEGQMPDTAGLPKTPDVSFLSEFSQAGGVGAMHTDEVDPLAEADVYLAYGRDEQAEEILKEAVAKDGGRLELKVKLLEIYAQRHDRKTFEIVAEEIYAASEGRGPLWEKVEEMGRKLDPEHPLFRGDRREAAAGAEADDEPLVAAGLGDRIDFAAVARELEEVSAPRQSMPVLDDQEGGLEWSVAGGRSEPERPVTAEIGQPLSEPSVSAGGADDDQTALDFSLDLGHPSELVADDLKTSPTRSAAQDAQAEALDFEWNPSAPAAKSESAGAEDFAIQFDDEEMRNLTADDLNLKDVMIPPKAAERPFEILGTEGAQDEGELVIEAEESPGSDAVDTQLDLARAYMEMGDNEGARGILEEVRAEGSAAQRAVAEGLMGTIRV